MIVKPYKKNKTARHDPRQQAGAVAEQQMAHYLHRRFIDDPETCVLQDLRIEDRAQPEQNGFPGVCQIDHLVVHRWGMFIVESKSVTQEVRVRSDGSDGDEWTRVYRGKESGMPSPIRQARRQSEFLRTFLHLHREELLGKGPFGSRTFTKFLIGSDQRGFRHCPIQLIIAVSDKGKITREGWKEPQKPFRVFVTKADLATEKIDQELRHHRTASLTGLTSRYGMWYMKGHEVMKVARFLAEWHVDRSDTVPPSKPAPADHCQESSPDKAVRLGDVAEAVCKHCGAKDLNARLKYSYYWHCNVCGKNTAMPNMCSVCGTEGRWNKAVRIRKEGPKYLRHCKECGASETIWTEK